MVDFHEESIVNVKLYVMMIHSMVTIYIMPLSFLPAKLNEIIRLSPLSLPFLPLLNEMFARDWLEMSIGGAVQTSQYIHCHLLRQLLNEMFSRDLLKMSIGGTVQTSEYIHCYLLHQLCHPQFCCHMNRGYAFHFTHK